MILGGDRKRLWGVINPVLGKVLSLLEYRTETQNAESVSYTQATKRYKKYCIPKL